MSPEDMDRRCVVVVAFDAPGLPIHPDPMPAPRSVLHRGPFVLAIAVAFAGCSADSGLSRYDVPRGAERAMVGVTTEMTSEGRRALQVESDSSFFQPGSDETLLVGVHASMFSAEGIAEVTIEADSAILESGGQRLIALGRVLVRDRVGTSVETTQLVFDASTSRLTSDSATEVRRNGGTQTGPCFESDSQLTQWRFCDAPP